MQDARPEESVRIHISRQSSFRTGFSSVCCRAIQSERIKEVVLHVFADIVGKSDHPFMQPVHDGMYANAFLQYREELR